MTLLEEVQNYIQMLKNNQYTHQENSRAVKKIEVLFQNAGDLDELIDAKKLLLNFHGNLIIRSEPIRGYDNSDLSKASAIGAAIGGGLGFFAGNIRVGALVGAVIGFQAKAMPYTCATFNLKKQAEHLIGKIDERMEFLRPDTHRCAGPG